jgi:hypothetical protein
LIVALWWWHESVETCSSIDCTKDCCDIYCYGINCALVGYNKNNKNLKQLNSVLFSRTTCFGLGQAILRFTNSFKNILRQKCTSACTYLPLKHRTFLPDQGSKQLAWGVPSLLPCIEQLISCKKHSFLVLLTLLGANCIQHVTSV